MEHVRNRFFTSTQRCSYKASDDPPNCSHLAKQLNSCHVKLMLEQIDCSFLISRWKISAEHLKGVLRPTFSKIEAVTEFPTVWGPKSNMRPCPFLNYLQPQNCLRNCRYMFSLCSRSLLCTVRQLSENGPIQNMSRLFKVGPKLLEIISLMIVFITYESHKFLH